MSNLRTGVAISHRDQLPSSSRYELLVKIASGGMATVYVGRLSSAAGISRLVAVKRAHAHLLEDASFAKMLVTEARLASKIHHPNVVAVHNVEEIEGELLLVMDYVEGASLYELVVPQDVAVRVILDACAGLHAAHGLADDEGRPLGIVHRDVSPHNILVGVDGIARLTDFGIAKSSGHTQSGGKTSTGALKGKVSYMAPEYVESGHLDARSDVFSLGVVAWEALTQKRLFRGASEVETLKLVLATNVPDDPSLHPAIAEVLMRALARAPKDRYESAAELADALERAARDAGCLATHAEVAAFVKKVAGDALAARRSLIRDRNAPSSAPEGEEEAAFGRTEATASITPDAAPTPRFEPTKTTITARAVEPPRSSRLRAYGIATMLVAAGAVVGIAKLARRDEPPPAVAAAASTPASPSFSSSSSSPPTTPIVAEPKPTSMASSPPAQPTQTVATKRKASSPAVVAKPQPSPPSAPPAAAAPVETTAPASDRAPPNPYAK